MDTPNHLQAEIEHLASVHGHDRTALLPVLRDLNSAHSYLSEEAMACVAKELRVPRSEVYGVATFYSYLSVKPRGKYIIRLCRTISCAIQGRYHPVVTALIEELGVSFGETTRDGVFTLEQTNCIGLCDQGPAMLVNDNVHVRLTEASVRAILGEYRRTVTSDAMVNA
jgi:NADH:ubiquinone oxidoreductase subunit E